MRHETSDTKQSLYVQIAGLFFAMVVGTFLIFGRDTISPAKNMGQEYDLLEASILPPGGIVLAVRWNDLGIRLVESGVVDAQKFELLYADRGELNQEIKQLLYDKDNGNIKIDPKNAGLWLNLLWAFGLSNKNPILEEGPMMKYNGDASGFASTGGWTLAKGSAMDHYSSHEFVALTPKQQIIVERVSKNIYRPCCGNSTYFPDCNHGMAMLGLLELLAAQDVSEDEIYKIALQINSHWFPDTYLTIAKYFQTKGISWGQINFQEVLGRDYSSASGYQKILNEVGPFQNRGGQSCGV